MIKFVQIDFVTRLMYLLLFITGCRIIYNRQRTIWHGKGVYCGSGTELPKPSLSVLQKPTGNDPEVYTTAFVTAAYLYTR